MSRPLLRYTIGDLLLATMLSALPLAFQQWTGLLAAISLSLMPLALIFGYGLVALVLMCMSLVSAASLDTRLSADHSPIGAFVTTVALTLAIALALRFNPSRRSQRVNDGQ